MSDLIFTEQASGTTPSSGKHTVYFKTDGFPYTKNSAGTETPMTGSALFSQALTDFANNAGTTTGLTYGYQAGVIRSDNATTAVAAGTVSLTASTTNYVEVTGAGVVSANIVGFTSGSFPLAIVATGASSITTITDKRGFANVGAATAVTDKARMYTTTTQAIPAATFTKVQMNLVSFDTNGLADTSNFRIKPKKPGYYQVAGRASVTVTAAGQRCFTMIYKNGAEAVRGVDATTSTGTGVGLGAGATDVIYFNGTTDYVEMYIYCSAAMNLEVSSGALHYLSVAGPL